MPQVKVIQPISEQSKKLRVAAYARVSSDSADQLNSFATQVDYYTGYIQSKDEWEFAGLYADEAISGITEINAAIFSAYLLIAMPEKSIAFSSSQSRGLHEILWTVFKQFGS